MALFPNNSHKGPSNLVNKLYGDIHDSHWLGGSHFGYWLHLANSDSHWVIATHISNNTSQTDSHWLTSTHFSNNILYWLPLIHTDSHSLILTHIDSLIYDSLSRAKEYKRRQVPLQIDIEFPAPLPGAYQSRLLQVTCFSYTVILIVTSDNSSAIHYSLPQFILWT